MKSLSLSLSLIFTTFSFLFSQSIQLETTGITRAVVIGISDYQNEMIPDLQYADKDAEAFVSYLQSSSGGNLHDDNIRLLTNEAATAGQMWAKLDWLIDESKEGDVAVIYFSGHGDVEKKLIDEPGYLLAWDSPSRSYYTGGVIPINAFKDIIRTLSEKNKAKVVVITDACRAGALAGEKYGGAQMSNASLAKEFANEIKILSCQPDEFSIEGEQWGGGRGIFSYHLIEGLYGMADEDEDLKVNLKEIERYLEDKVSTEAEPHQQTPMTRGNIKEIVSNVDEKMMANIQKDKNPMIKSFSAIDQKGFVEDVLANVDSNIIDLYFAFQDAVDKKQFFEPKATCADTLYLQLTKVKELKPLYNQMRRNYAAALQDDAQQMINRIVFQPEKEALVWFSPQKVRDIYGPYPKMLDRAAELLGSEHYMYSVLKARKAFFEGGIIYLQKIYWRDLISGTEAIKKLKESLKWQHNAPHTYLWMAMTYHYNLQQRDSAYHYIQKAIEYAPEWSVAHYWEIKFYTENRDFKHAKKLMDEITVIDSSDVTMYYSSYASWYRRQGNLAKAVEYSDTLISLDPNNFITKGNHILSLGFMGKKEESLKIFNEIIIQDSTSSFLYYFMGNMYYLVGEYGNSIIYFKKALLYDPSMIWAYSQAGDAMINLELYDEAERLLLQGYSKDSTYMPLVNALGGVYAGKKDLTKADYFYKKAIEFDDSNMLPYYNLAMVQSQQNHFVEAIKNLEIFLKKGGVVYFDHIQSNSDLDGMRESPEFKALMKKYFPDKYKD